MENKICITCKELRPLTTFKKSKKGEKEFRANECEKCKYNKLKLDPIRYKKFREKANERRKRAYYKNGKEKEFLKSKKFVSTHVENGTFKALWLKNKYGITIEDYLSIKERQNHSCAICKISEKDYGKSLHVDHCHVTGKVRGLLCHNCNLSIGSFKDNITILQNAISYLKNNS